MNQILYRGYNDSGAPIQSKVKFQPTLYIKSNEESPFLALDGTPVSPIKFDSMSEAKQFMKRYEDIHEFKIYGQDRWTFQFIADKWPNDSPNQPKHYIQLFLLLLNPVSLPYIMYGVLVIMM
jgi:hypothetical protein